MIEKGIKGREEVLVTEENCALTVGSGTLKVFATPAMSALMEKTAWKSVAPFLEEGQSTVGTMLNLTHISATPIGMKVVCESELVAVEGRKLVFKLSVSDEAGLIGECEHERFIVYDERFQSKAQSKLKK